MNANADPKTLSILSDAQTQGRQAPPLRLAAPEAGSHGAAVRIPSSSMLTVGDYARIGLDLMITGPNGEQVLVQDYFLTDAPPDLVADDGARISGDLAESLAGSMAPGQFAQAGAGGVARQSIGHVETISGPVNVVHADGSKGVLNKGDSVFQGDVLQTSKGAAVGLLFVDKTSLSLGSDGRMVLDQMVFDPSSGTGKSAFSLVQGTFSFVSGQIAKTAPDAMTVRTPVATIGIRGTLGSGGYSPEQGLTVAVLSEGGQGTGEVTISNAAGSQTINTANSAVLVTSFFNPPPPAFSFTPQQFANSGFAQTLTALPPTPASAGAAATVLQIQNLAPAAGAPGAAAGPQAPGAQTGPQAPGQAAPAAPGEGLAFGLVGAGEAGPAAPQGPAQGQTAQMFSAAAQAAIDQAISQGASIEQAQAAAMNVQAVFNNALSQGAAPQQALAAAGQAAVQMGLLAAPLPGGAPGAGGPAAANPFAAMATGQASISSMGIMQMGPGPGQAGAAANAAATAIAGGANPLQAFGAGAQAGIAAAIGQGATPEQAAAAAEAAFGAAGGFGGGGGFGPTSFFGTGGVGTFSGGGNQFGADFGFAPGGFGPSGYGPVGYNLGGVGPGGFGPGGDFFGPGGFGPGGFGPGGDFFGPGVFGPGVFGPGVFGPGGYGSFSFDFNATDTTSSNNDNSIIIDVRYDSIVFADTLDGTTGSDALVGGSGNTDFVISQATLGGADVLTDGGGTRDRVTFTNLAAVKLTLQDLTSGDGFVNVTAAPMSASGGSLVAGVAYDTAISISTGIEDIQASTGTLADGVLLTNAMTSANGIVDNPGNYGYIVAGTASGASTDDVIDASVTSAGYFPSPIGSIIFGLDGNDTITGTTADDVIYGDSGNDIITGGAGNNKLDGGDGNDWAWYSGADSVTVYMGTGTASTVYSSVSYNDSLSGIEHVKGSGGNDFFYFSNLFTSATSVTGGAGTDTLILTGDYSSGVSLTHLDTVETVSLSGGTSYNVTLGVSTSALTYIDASTASSAIFDGSANGGGFSFHGSAGADSIIGGSANDTLVGGSSADSINGGSGFDTLIGGMGSDHLTGGAGNDVFYYTGTPSILGVDTITDFVSGTDKFFVDATSFGFGLSLSETANSKSYITSTTAMGGTGYDFNLTDTSTGVGIIVIGANTGTAGVEVWYTTNQEAASTSNSYQIATLSGINTSQVAVTDFQTTA
ncbi:hypothetical protein MTBLM1_90119 [Rhodospirillaceae bacterium LM-1]|nr:hypothetical protein MTBLM1_90119 [Rhodospirillaceae bacterium LM-1]